MRHLAVVLTAMLIAGCATAPQRDAAVEPSPLSTSSWQQLQLVLQDAPVDLRRAITQAGEARLGHFDQALSQKNAPEPEEPHAVLLDILTHTHQPALLPDAAFEPLHHAVVGEKRHLRQAYATALAGYLVQSDFGCQQPLYAAYFQRRYAAGQVAKPCSERIPFSVMTQYEGVKIVWLDPRRVKSIHLMFAGKSQSLASRFGHVALRLVVCPDGKNAATDCDANLFEHIVLGFQAYIDELSLDTLKALNGKYKAYLFANRFMDVYQQYAIDEFREVYSLPLRLGDAQRELMVRELADIHWRYAGEYSFFTSNCATMMQDALRVSWPEFGLNDKTASDYLRPDSLFEAVKAGPLAEGDRLASLEVAEREGYFFSSTRQFYDQAVSEVRDAMKHPEYSDLDSYLQIPPVKRRQARSEDAQFAARLAGDRHLREAQIMLEEYAVLHSERVLMIEGTKYLEQQDFLKKADSIRGKLDAEHARAFDDCLMTPVSLHANPLQRLKGIPDKSDIPEVSGQTSGCQSVQDRKLLREAIAGMMDAKSEQWQRLNEISQYWAESIANLNLLKQM